MSRLRVTVAASCFLIASLPAVAGQGGRSNTAALDRHLPARIERVYLALAKGFSPARAMAVVTFMSTGWRLAGNPAFEASEGLISQELADAGFRVVASAIDAQAVVRALSASRARPGTQWYEEFPLNNPAWEPRSATIEIIDPKDFVIIRSWSKLRGCHVIARQRSCQRGARAQVTDPIARFVICSGCILLAVYTQRSLVVHWPYNAGEKS